MQHKAQMAELLRPHALSLVVKDWDAVAEYETDDLAQKAYWRLVEWGYDAMCLNRRTTAYLTDEMIARDETILLAVVNGIERHLPDVCEGLEPEECWEETFHLAHDWLIDNRNYLPHVNEEIAISAADELFPREEN